jgi:hypothetical protein
MRPKQAVINNNIQKHTSQTGSSEDYRIRPPSSTTESIVTRHVSAFGGRPPPPPSQVPLSARYQNQNIIPENSSNVRSQSSIPLYTYSNNYYPVTQNSAVNFNNIPLQSNPVPQLNLNQNPVQMNQIQPNQQFLYQDLNTGMYYVPYVDSNQFASPRPLPQQYPYSSQQYVPHMANISQPQGQHIIHYPAKQSPLPSRPLTSSLKNGSLTDIELSPLAYDESYTDRSIFNQSRLINAYSPEPIIPLTSRYKPIPAAMKEVPNEHDVNDYFPVDNKA